MNFAWPEGALVSAVMFSYGIIFVEKCCYLNMDENEKHLNKPCDRNGCRYNRTDDIM